MISIWDDTRHKSADCMPTSNLACNRDVAIRTSFSHMIKIAEIIYYTCNLVIDIQYTRYDNAVFNELCGKATLLRSIPNKF